MIHCVFSVYDSKAESYLQPFFSQNCGTAIRSMSEATQDVNHNFHKYAADYTLFQIGKFDDQSGDLVSLSAKKSLGTALELMNVYPKE